MSKAEAARKLYEECKDMDIEETMDLVLSAETEEEQDFFSMLSDFYIAKKAKACNCPKEVLNEEIYLICWSKWSRKVNIIYDHTLYDMMPRVNTDEILREFGDWRNTRFNESYGRIAVERLNSYLSEGITFNQETTLCGHSILRTIYRAKQLGGM